MKTRAMVWLWRQEPDRHGFDAEKVNTWARRFREHCTLPDVELACVTNIPGGLDPSIAVIPLPADFPNVAVRHWRESTGAPQCLRRLDLFRPDAAQRYGADWLVSMDVDVTFHGSVDDLFRIRPDSAPLKLYRGTCARAHYNGGLVMLKAGARPDIYARFMEAPENIAGEARKRFIGSDQAVLSLLLGARAVPTWAEADGVFHYSPRLVRQYPSLQVGPPRGARMVFYPGTVKPWSRDVPWAWVRDSWDGRPLRPRRERPARLHAYDDRKGWGRQFAVAAQKRGHNVALFTRGRPTSPGLAFVRLDQQGGERERSKALVEELAQLGHRTLPRLEEARWYDDKVAQLRPLGPWLPPTIYATSRAEALRALTVMRYPFVSKALEGSASKCVRLVNNTEQARLEVDRVFSGAGVPSVYGRHQRGYVYWQDFIAGNARDYRVCVVGDFLYGLVRENRPGTPFASGSGQHVPLRIAGDSSGRARAALELAKLVAAELETQWMAFDIVFDAVGRGYVLELSSAWTMDAYADCPCYHRSNLSPASRTGRDSFDIAVEVAELIA